MKYFLHLAYNGTKYHGWQRQEQVPSIQATIEDDLRKMFHPELTIHGCGRTDAGVHASSYYAHFVIDKEIEFDLIYKLNRMLPDDIVIYDLIPVVEKANAQLDAISRTYEYHIHLKKDPFLVEKSACYDVLDLDLELMKTAASLLTQYEDFKYFCLQPELHKHTICKLSEASMKVNKTNDRILFRFTSDRFLRGMIRIIVGRLLDVGQGKVSPEELERSLNLQLPNKFMKQAYPQGLYLSEVKYREGILK
jgi:tRNA pseudouridine38-40 synthase